MPKKRWTTPEQRSWLEVCIPAFIQAQQDRAVSVFLDDTYRKWQEKWPVTAPTEEEVQGAEGNSERTVAAKWKAVEDVSTHDFIFVQTYTEC